MNHEKLAEEYEHFFVKNEAGGHFMSFLQKLIEDSHRSAENNPDKARDYVQRAKAARDVADHIQNVMTPIKKGKQM